MGFHPDEEIVPHDLIMSWRGACTCRWQGELWQRVLTPAEADLDARKEYCPPGEGAYVSERVEDAVQDEWMIHIAPSEAILGVEAAAKEHRQTSHRPDKTVAAPKPPRVPGPTSAVPQGSAAKPPMSAGPTNRGRPVCSGFPMTNLWEE